MLRFIYSFCVRWVLKLIVGIRFKRADFLLAESQFIIVANHNSHMDTLSLMASLPGTIVHKVKPVAAADHFGKTAFMTGFSRYFINALLIDRTGGRRESTQHPIEQMVAALDLGFSLIVFPEGTRGQPDKENPFKTGIARLLLQRPLVKYVPAYLKGMGKILPKGEKLIIPHDSSLKFGKPAFIASDQKDEILKQIEADFLALRNAG